MMTGGYNVQRWKTDDVEHLENILRYLCKHTETWSKIQSFIQWRQSFICGTVTVAWTRTHPSDPVTHGNRRRYVQVSPVQSSAAETLPFVRNTE